jgi:hypothetical protein
MPRLLRADPDELDVYVTRIAAATGIPANPAWKPTTPRAAADAYERVVISNLV